MNIPPALLSDLAKRAEPHGSTELLRWYLERGVIQFGNVPATRRQRVALAIVARGIKLWRKAGGK